MSTRTTLEGDCLIERCIGRDSTLASIHVKAELDRLARQVRKLKRRSNERMLTPSPYLSYLAGLEDALDLITQQKR